MRHLPLTMPRVITTPSLLIGVAEADWAAAVRYALKRTCQHHGPNPYGYLEGMHALVVNS
ncbi:hypothetical protein [Haloferula sp. A504]|uniref:hypothetical protein n=1 Tax=Haloferula sp. A504 TaxID=3373601 RepID=UPI0031C09ABC|nr:hypothetical protein [Verrucomicrobiaceae bacterium E54]